MTNSMPSAMIAPFVFEGDASDRHNHKVFVRWCNLADKDEWQKFVAKGLGTLYDSEEEAVGQAILDDQFYAGLVPRYVYELTLYDSQFWLVSRWCPHMVPSFIGECVWQTK